jgi:hypothetical protein
VAQVAEPSTRKAPGQSSGSGSKPPRTCPKQRSAVPHQPRIAPWWVRSQCAKSAMGGPFRRENWREGTCGLAVTRACRLGRPDTAIEHAVRRPEGST